MAANFKNPDRRVEIVTHFKSYSSLSGYVYKMKADVDL